MFEKARHQGGLVVTRFADERQDQGSIAGGAKGGILECHPNTDRGSKSS